MFCITMAKNPFPLFPLLPSPPSFSQILSISQNIPTTKWPTPLNCSFEISQSHFSHPNYRRL